MYIYIYIGMMTDAVANMLDCNILVSDFVLQSRSVVHFQTNTFGNGIKLLIPPVMG